MTLLAILISLSLSFKEPAVHTVKGYDLPHVPGCVNFGEPGEPMLPVKPILVKADSLKIRVKSKVLSGKYKVLPTPESVPISRPDLFRGFIENSKIYSSSKSFPEKPYRVVGRRVINGKNYLEVLIYPVSYIPSQGELIFNSEFTIEGAINLNFELEVPDSYVIITSSTLAPYFNPLIQWKRRKGLRAGIVTLDEIYSTQWGRDNAEKIRNYLKTHRGIGYVLLGGDTDIVPARFAFAMDAGTGNPSDNQIPADLYYADLNGSWDFDGDGVFGEVEDSVDLVPDLIVARAPVSTPAQVQNFVNKVINYERYHSSGYFGDGLFLASYLDDVTDGGKAKDNILEILPDTISITRLYERFANLNRNTALHYISLGFNFINHNGHGNTYLMQVGPDYLNPWDFDALNNGDKITGILYSIGCWTCAFDSDCIAEHFVNTTGGGFYIGNSRYGWYIPGFPGYSSSDLFDRKFFEFIASGETKPGRALALSKSYFAPLSRTANDFRWNEYTLTYLGDPEMDLFLKNPSSLTFTTPDSIPCGQSSFAISVSSENGSPVQGASVAVLQQDSLIGRFFTDRNGIAFVKLNLNSCNPVTISIFKAGFLYAERTIPVYTSPFNIEVVDYGNDEFLKYFADDSADTLFVKLYNNSDSTLRNLVFEFVSEGVIYPQRDTVALDSIRGGDSTIVYVPITVEHVSRDTSITVYFNSVALRIEILKKRVELGGYFYPYLQRNSTGFLTLTFINPLPIPLKNVSVGIRSLDTRVEVSDTSVLIDEIQDTTEVSLMVSTASTTDTLFFPRILVIDDTVTLSVGFTGYEYSFESGSEGWSVENGHWHITSHRASHGNFSFYVGNEGSYRYAPNFVASLLSPDLIIPDGATLKFDTYYETQPGWDFCMVEVISQETLHVATYGGPSMGWESHEYDLSFLSPGSHARLRFTFYSEDNSVQLEGWYIDNVSLTRGSISTDIPEETGDERHNLTAVVTGKSTIRLKEGNYLLLDISGRTRRAFTGQVVDFRGLPSGIYFVAQKGRAGIKVVRKVVYIR